MDKPLTHHEALALSEGDKVDLILRLQREITSHRTKDFQRRAVSVMATERMVKIVNVVEEARRNTSTENSAIELGVLIGKVLVLADIPVKLASTEQRLIDHATGEEVENA